MSDRYRIKRRLGRGGMAEVFLAEFTGAEGFTKPVALKRVLPHLASDERISKMFLAEAMIARHLHHQNVVEVLDVGRSSEGLFLAMELVDGWDFGRIQAAAAVAKTALPGPLGAFVAVQVLSGLCHAYGRKRDGKPLLTAHRDVSPQNILVSREGEVKIGDFGIAKLLGSAGLTDPGTVKGKLAFAAPEVMRGEEATAAADQFSLGVTLYEMFSNRAPFGDSTAPALHLEKLLQERPAQLPGLPLAFWNILSRMLQVRVADRYASAEALLTAWATELARCGTPATPRELAAYLQGLNLGPTALELPEAPTEPGFTLKSATWMEADLSGSWKPEGPQLDASGRLTREKAPAERALSDALGETADDLAPATVDPTTEKLGGWSEAPSTLELAYDPLANRHPDPEPSPERSRGKLAVAVIGLLVIAGGAVALLGPRYMHRVPLPMAIGGSHLLQLSSEPAGAEVRIAGAPVGQTPLFIDNVYPPGEIRVEIRLRGYQTWKGTFRGSEEARVDAVLVR